MAVITLLPEAVRGNTQSGSLTIPSSSPVHVQFDMQSSTFASDPTLTFSIQVERSFNGGSTWEAWFGATLPGGTGGQHIGKNGAVVDGLYHQTTSLDGIASLARANITVNTAFSWGLTATILAA